MAEPMQDVDARIDVFAWLFLTDEGFAIRTVYQGGDGHFHDIEYGCGVEKYWFMERMGPNIGVDVWLDCPDCGRLLESRGLAVANGDREFCEQVSSDQVGALLSVRKALMPDALITGDSHDETDTETDAEDAWDEYVESQRTDLREQLEDEYLEEMSATVDERLAERIAELEANERDEFIDTYHAQHPDDEDEDDVDEDED